LKVERCIATIDNIKLLKKANYSYIVIERISVEKLYEKEFETVKETFIPLLAESRVRNNYF
jgi:hypothetical protein